MSKRVLFHTGWEFCRQPLGTTPDTIHKEQNFSPVELPHDWLICNTEALYETGEGWYRKRFLSSHAANELVYLRFEGIYMDSTIYINGREAFTWKYGYSSFEFELTPFLTAGENEIYVRVVHQSPNSRWYSGAGIYRNVWLITRNPIHFTTDGLYVSITNKGNHWMVAIDSGLILPPEADTHSLAVRHSIMKNDGTLISAAFDSAFDQAMCYCPYQNKDIPFYANYQTLLVDSPELWDVETPNLYQLNTELLCNGEVIDFINTQLGFRSASFTPEDGFLLNGRKLRLNGACEHHDLGCLGSAVNRTALRRQLLLLQEMGVNAIRTSHNMPAVELMELADELGILIVSEAFDMWEHPKTKYDYARFFPEWCRRDTASWIRRDRNHPSVILWSIGNEIYDTHADEHGQEITRRLMEYVYENDPRHNAPVTIGSNFMPWEGAQKCADIVKHAGYNYSERYYMEHHKKHPDWIIYGSETSSVVQSRGIYHFPYSKPILADDDEQCSSLGNSSTSWGAKSTLACIADDRDTPYSAGQFIWTGFDYIGEPTPYHTKNSYFGQIDTAGFPKDSFYIFQAEWTDYHKAPMVHLFPYWDFNEGQPIDLLVCSNAPRVELFFNDSSLGCRNLDHLHGRDDLLAHWQMAYTPGTLKAVAYDECGQVIAADIRSSFGEAATLTLCADKETLCADGRDLIFLTISAADQDGFPVENANNRVHVSVSGAGRLLGLDNGDSTDFDQYKTTSRRLFSGRLLAVIGATLSAGDIKIDVTSPGLPAASLTLHSRALTETEYAVSSLHGTLLPSSAVLMKVTDAGYTAFQASADLGTAAECSSSAEKNVQPLACPEIPIRKIVLTTDHGLAFSPECRSMTVTASLLPANASYSDLTWRITNNTGIDSNLAKLETEGNRAMITALGDGEFYIRCMTKNGGPRYQLISQLCFTASGLGSAVLDPYHFISAGLYNVSAGAVTNGNERGVATSREGETMFGFTGVDFGDFGSDELTIPIFALSSAPYQLKIWEGVPGTPDAELLADVIYQKPAIWNVYQEETFRLQRRIRGLTTLCFTTNDKLHVRGFTFTAPQKAFAKLSALDNSRIYGDTFTIETDAITGIGNNVSLEFDEMDFGEKGFRSLSIEGRSSLPKNTIHVRFSTADGEMKQIAEFLQCDDYTMQRFTLEPVYGCCKVTFVFLPGCSFDFKSFCFEN